jgi:uncharacterized protein YegP (UPF0339 family)
MTEKFEMWESSKDGQWYFHLKAPNGEVIVSSEGYSTKDNCTHGIESVKEYSSNADTHETTEE